MFLATMEILRFWEGVILKEGLCVNLDGWDSGLGGRREYIQQETSLPIQKYGIFEEEKNILDGWGNG